MTTPSRGTAFRITLPAAGLALALAAGPAAAGGCGDGYTVRPGDTLSRIAAACDTSVQALMQANPQITSPARIAVGWTLSVPGAGGAAADGEDELAAIPAADGRVSLTGRILNGRRCALLATPEGEEYGVVSPELSFVSGREVEVEGRLVDDPTCIGPRTLLVTGLSIIEL